VSLWFNAVAAPAPRALPPVTENKIRALLKAPDVQAGHIGVLISALGTAKSPQDFPAVPYDNKTQPVLFAQDADKRFLPASNMKLFTSAIALKVLGAEKTFETQVIVSGQNPQTEVYQYTLWGNGDPSLTTDDLRKLVAQLKNSRWNKPGALLVVPHKYRAETLGGRFPNGWTLDDTLWYYGPEISALAFNRNHVDLTVIGGQKPGDAVTAQIEPDLPGFQVGKELRVQVVTGEKELASRSGDELLTVNRSIGEYNPQILMTVQGKIAPGQKVSFGLAVPYVERWAKEAFTALLAESGVTMHKSQDVPPIIAWGSQFWARHHSPPVKELLKRLLKNSDNLYAEMMLRNAAWESLKPEDRMKHPDYAQRGHQLIFDWLKENKVSTDGLSFSDGSGLSRYNMVTPRAVNGLLSAAEKLPGAEAFWNALPIAGVDGTMRNRSKGTLAENNARAKSGTFSIVSCLSGYVTTKDKQRLSVVILTNFVPSGSAARRLQDDIFKTLAEADWKAN
jgi:PBP4 family serine-type D-alanyl-D-alanine carboxypeptidase